MDLFERYLHAVGSFLPKRHRDDIIRELSEDLRSQVEEREAAIGRALDQAEQEAILKQWGHPLLLASRYQPQRQLIGPAMFPIYWLVLRISLGVALLVHVIAATVMLANAKAPGEVIERLVTLPFGPLLIVFAWVTVVFAVLDRSVPRLPLIAKWNPSSLPEGKDKSTSPSMACRIGDVTLATLFVLWLAAVPHNQWLIFGPATTLIELAPIWFEIHLWLLLLATASLAVSWVNLLSPQRHTFRVATKVAGSVVSILLFWFLVNAEALIVPAASAGAAAERVAAITNNGMRLGFMIAGIASAAGIVWEAVRLVWRLRLPRYSSF